MVEAYLGIDVSKGYSDFILINGSFEQLESTFQLDDTAKGHAKLKLQLERWIDKHNLSMIYCGLESTGGFEDNWYGLLCNLVETLPVRAARLNPSVVKNAAKASNNHQTTDALSAKNIASYLVRYGDDVDYDSRDNVYREFRSLQNHIRLLVKQKTQAINEFKQLLYRVFPELQSYCSKGVPHWVLEVLCIYPTPQVLAAAKAEKVAGIKNVSLSKAQTLIERAKKSISTRGNGTDAQLIASMAGDLKQRDIRIKELKKLLTKSCDGPEIDILIKQAGIGKYSAARIMIEIEDITRFPSPGQVVSYFGMHPTIKESGDKRSVSRMSKRGRPALRETLFMCAKTAIIHDPHMKAIYLKHRAKGKNYTQALGVVMHKMLRIIWAVLTYGEPYNCKIDVANQMKNTSTNQTTEEKELIEKRRIQPFDADAPLSNLAKRKRKAHLLSQSGNAENVRDLVDVPVVQT